MAPGGRDLECSLIESWIAQPDPLKTRPRTTPVRPMSAVASARGSTLSIAICPYCVQCWPPALTASRRATCPRWGAPAPSVAMSCRPPEKEPVRLPRGWSRGQSNGCRCSCSRGSAPADVGDIAGAPKLQSPLPLWPAPSTVSWRTLRTRTRGPPAELASLAAELLGGSAVIAACYTTCGSSPQYLPRWSAWTAACCTVVHDIAYQPEPCTIACSFPVTKIVTPQRSP